MDDLFAAAKPPPEPKPKVRLWNGHLVHDCHRCGAPNAAFGDGVRLLKDEPGTWHCFTCWKLVVAKRGAGK
jgi:hypothetical protein